jgi:hypothetical protein
MNRPKSKLNSCFRKENYYSVHAISSFSTAVFQFEVRTGVTVKTVARRCSGKRSSICSLLLLISCLDLLQICLTSSKKNSVNKELL